VYFSDARGPDVMAESEGHVCGGGHAIADSGELPEKGERAVS